MPIAIRIIGPSSSVVCETISCGPSLNQDFSTPRNHGCYGKIVLTGPDAFFSTLSENMINGRFRAPALGQVTEHFISGGLPSMGDSECHDIVIIDSEITAEHARFVL